MVRFCVRVKFRLSFRVRLRVRVRVRVNVSVSVRVRVRKKYVYGFHEMLMCEMHMCFSEMIHCCWRYEKYS